jgi:integrase
MYIFSDLPLRGMTSYCRALSASSRLVSEIKMTVSTFRASAELPYCASRPKYRSSPFIFGAPTVPSTQTLCRVARRWSTSLPNIRLYDLRHTAATLALTVGVSPKVVSEQLGHTSAAFTLDVYSHVLPHMQDDAAAKVEAALIGSSATDG